MIHEIGHLLGFDHSASAQDVMSATLPAGVRRLLGVGEIVSPPHASGVFAPEPAGEWSWTPEVELPIASRSPDMVVESGFLLLLQPPVIDRVRRLNCGREPVDVRTLDDVLDEETELVEEELLDLLVGRARLTT
jgi:hypothetical protein